MSVPPFKYLVIDDDEIDRICIETEAAKFPFLHHIASCAHSVENIHDTRSRGRFLEHKQYSDYDAGV